MDHIHNYTLLIYTIIKVPGPNVAADSSQRDVKYWLLHQGAAKELHPLDVLLEARVDTRAIIFSVFLKAKMRSCFDSDTRTLLGNLEQLYFYYILIL